MVSLTAFNATRSILRQRSQSLFSILYRSFCAHDLKLKRETHSNLENILTKILYNEVLQNYKDEITSTANDMLRKKTELTQKPHCLQYLSGKKNIPEEKKAESTSCNDDVKASNFFQLPFAVAKSFVVDVPVDESIDDFIPQEVANFVPEDNNKITPPSQWDDYNEPLVQQRLNSRRSKGNLIRFGSSDPNTPVSNVPCGGCGALLQCMDERRPGFLPAEVFKSKRKQTLKSELCQRCFFLQEYNIGLGVNVSPEEYTKLLSQIKNKGALMVVMIDLLDFPCSIWPDISEIVGTNPVVIVANKADLIIRDSPNFENEMIKSIKDSLIKRGVDINNIINILITSAKYGYSVEKIIHTINYKWDFQGDVYLIGTTNVGKSTLFNTLIQSDLCLVDVENVIKRATVSAWPGTTLNLLKFPMKRLKAELLGARVKRLNSRRNTGALNEEKRKFSVLPDNKSDAVERTRIMNVTDSLISECEKWTPTFNEPSGLDANQKKFKQNKWCHDTPGVVLKDQITNLLTTSELLVTLPRETILPRNFLLTPGHSLFIGGLARIDFTKGSLNARITVYASMKLPITVTRTEYADEVYKALLGSNLLGVPSGDPYRLSKWPQLGSKNIEAVGKIENEACCDIVLSSAGWIAVYLHPAYYAEITAWTPEARGIHVRDFPLVKTGHLYRGRRIPRTPAYTVSVHRPKQIKNKPHW